MRRVGKATEAEKVTSPENTLSGRVSVLEHGVERLEHRVEAGFVDIAKSIRSLSEQLQSKGSPLPFKEIIGTALATAALVTYILTAMNGWFDQRAQPINLVVQRLAEQDKNGDLAVLKYRVQQLEMLKLGK